VGGGLLEGTAFMVEKRFLMPIPGSLTPFLTFLLRKKWKKIFPGGGDRRFSIM
jgi:hypothetical protein